MYCSDFPLVWLTSRLHVTPSYFFLSVTQQVWAESNFKQIVCPPSCIWSVASRFPSRNFEEWSMSKLREDFDITGRYGNLLGIHCILRKSSSVDGFCSSISQKITDVPNALSRKQRSCKAETRGGHCPWSAKVVRSLTSILKENLGTRYNKSGCQRKQSCAAREVSTKNG